METSHEFIGDVIEGRGEAIFIDGSRYQGTWDSLGIGGAGIFRMPHDVIFEGEIKDGMNHGQGIIKYPGKQIIDGIWNRGEIKKFIYTFEDGLIYNNEGWSYCQFPDRRFNRSKVSGLRPAGRSLKTEDQPTKVIPHGCYDTGDGIFDPKTLTVNSFDHPAKVLRIPRAEECKWIMKNCRKEGTEPTGYQPWLNENWSSDPPDLPYRIPMSKDSPELWWKRISTFEKDESVILEERRRAISSIEKSTYIEQLTQKFYRSFECVCESDRETEVEDICGGDRDSEEIISGIDIIREVVCEEIESSDEYEDSEDGEDLLMTVCCPPEGSYAIRRKKKLTMTLEIEDKSSEVEEEEEGGEGGGEEEEEEEEEKEENEEEDEEEELEISWKKKMGEEVDKDEKINDVDDEEEGYRVVLCDEDEEWEETREGMREGDYYLSDSKSGEMNESMIGKDYLISDMKIVRGSKELEELNSKMQRGKRESIGKGKKMKRTKQFPSKKYKKHPCPAVIDKDQILQRKVGDLLFSPALEAPRSPVCLTKNICDRKRCEKLKTPKYNKRVTKCGVYSSPFNLPSKYQGRSIPKVCYAGSSNKKKICQSSKLFVTLPPMKKIMAK